MRSLLLVALLLAALVSSAEARVVLCAGDSLTAGNAHNLPSYPDRLQALHPEWTVRNIGIGGAPSTLVDFVTSEILTTMPSDVVLLFGTNDEHAGLTVWESLHNLLAMARAARRVHARVTILTPPPMLCLSACTPDTPAVAGNVYTLALTHALYARRMPSGVTVADLRDALALDWRTITLEGIHPTSTGNDELTAFVDSVLTQH